MIPVGWTAAALLLWAHATGQIVLVAPLALLLEAGGHTPLRYAFESRQFERCADASSVLFAALALYQFNTHGLYGIYAVLALMPWCLLPLTLMQMWSTARETPLGALVYSLRRAGATTRVDLRLALGLSALVAASAGEVERATYGLGATLLLGWLVWVRRPRRPAAWRWGIAASLAGALALGLQSGYLQLHLLLGDLAQDWFRELNIEPADATRTSTAIGSLRQLKLSDRIYLRVQSASGPPGLLTEATYSDFRYGSWSNRGRATQTLDAMPGARRWRLTHAAAPGERHTISLTRTREIGVVPLPAGTSEVAGERILELQRLAGDALQVEAPGGLLSYTVTSGHGARLRPPTVDDDVVPADYRALLERMAGEVGLTAVPPAVAVARLRAFFARDFRYSLVQPSSLPWRTPLATFLTTGRRGHCEHFASATALLLRAAGIPTRYAVGYAVDEYSRLEGAWLARARDAHAWVYAWYDGAWQVVDTTPATWAALEDARAAPWQAAFDGAAWLAHAWRRLQAGDAPALRRTLLGCALVLAGWLVWRQRRRLQRGAPPTARPHADVDGGALAPLLARLAQRGDAPAPGETLARFLRRRLPARSGDARLETLIGLYYTSRFGTRALDADERARLADCVAAYLRES